MLEAGVAIGVERRGREDVLPSPLAVGVPVFLGQGERERSATKPAPKILIVLPVHPRELGEEALAARSGQHGNAVLRPFAVADRHLVTIEVEILDPQGQALDDAQAGAVEELAYELGDAAHRLEDGLDFAASQHHG